MGNETIVVTGAEATKFYQMLARKHALYLELKGLKTRNGSVYALVKRVYGLRGSKQVVYTLFCELCEKTRQELGITSTRKESGTVVVSATKQPARDCGVTA